MFKILFSIPIFKQDTQINEHRIFPFYIAQFVCILVAVGISKMKLIQISDIFWDTIPIIILPMFLEMILAYHVFTKRVEDGTMDFILSTSIHPKVILFTKAAFITGAGYIMILFAMIVGLVTKVYGLAGYWSAGSFFFLNFGALCLQFFLSGYCIFIACRAGSLLEYVKLAVTIPVIMYLIYLIYYLTDAVGFLQFLTVFSLFRQTWYAKGVFGAYAGMILFLAGGTAFFYLAMKNFYSRILNN